MQFDARRYQRLCERVRHVSATRDVDAVHDAFLETHCSGLKHFEARACLRAKDQYRQRQRNLERFVPRDLSQLEARRSGCDPQMQFALNEEIMALRLVLGGLSPEYRQVVELRFFEELSPAEIAELLGVPVKTVYTRLDRAIKRLRRMLGGVVVKGVAA